MKIYLHLSNEGKEGLNEKAISTLKNAGVILVTNIEENYEADFSQKELRRLKMSGQNLLDKMDAFVIEATQPDPEVGYLLAYAMSQKKPVLYLVLKGTKIGGRLRQLPDHVVIKEYTEESVVEELMEFLRHLEQGWEDASPTIKFTLRITPQIERYLNWKANRKKITKADYLRDAIVAELLEKDEQYKKYLNRE